jgi:hypothetical protein
LETESRSSSLWKGDKPPLHHDSNMLEKFASIYVSLMNRRLQSLITAWGYIHGAIWFGMAICGFLANMFAGSDKPGFCCKYSWAILFWVFFIFYIGWWMTGNYWCVVPRFSVNTSPRALTRSKHRVFTNAIIPQLVSGLLCSLLSRK